MGRVKYHPCELEQILHSMVILVDTREQNTVRAKKRYKQFGCEFERKPLKFGDYSARLTGLNGEEINLESIVCIERKMNLDELCGCFCQGRKRFYREFERALATGAHVYLLIENDNLDNAYAGTYCSQMNPRALTASILAWSIKFKIIPFFISSDRSGQLIHDIFYREARAYLEKKENEDA